jgi:hypothetical protein
MQGGRVVWMQAKKVEKDGSDLGQTSLSIEDNNNDNNDTFS